MKIWHALSIWSTLLLLACAGSVIGIMYSGWRQSASTSWRVTANQTHQDVRRVMLENLDFLRFAANSVSIFTPALPATNFDPSELIRMFRAYDDASVYTFGSIGLLRAGNSTAATSKLSWQLALGFGCPEYIYAYSDAAINPVFLGNCAYKNGTVNWNQTAYSGFDWGLKPQEQTLLGGGVGGAHVFLPITNLLSQFTLTYEVVSLYAQTPVVSFAEMDLRIFSEYVANNVTVQNGKGYVYIFETTTANGPLVASTIGNVVNGSRILAADSSMPAPIRDTYAYAAANPTASDASVNSWRVSTSRYQDTGLDWTIVVVVADWDVYSNLYYLTGLSVGISILIIVICVVISVVGIRRIVQQTLKYLMDRARDPTLTEKSHLISEVDALDAVLGKRNTVDEIVHL
jgi:hypothetical protein